MPSYPQWVQLARKVVAGTESDDVVRSFKLHNAVVEKLPLDFDREAYEKASRAYKAVSSSSKDETQQQAKNTYIAEKRKVLIALANTVTKKVVKGLEAAQCDNTHSLLMNKEQADARAVLEAAQAAQLASLLHAQAIKEAQRTVFQQQGSCPQDVSKDVCNPSRARVCSRWRFART